MVSDRRVDTDGGGVGGRIARHRPAHRHIREPWSTPMRNWLSVADAAEHAAVSRDTIYTACERREMQHVRIGGRRTIRVRREWIDAWLERHVRRVEESQLPAPSSDGAVRRA